MNHLHKTDVTQKQSATTSHAYSSLSWLCWDFVSSKTESFGPLVFIQFTVRNWGWLRISCPSVCCNFLTKESETQTSAWADQDDTSKEMHRASSYTPVPWEVPRPHSRSNKTEEMLNGLKKNYIYIFSTLKDSWKSRISKGSNNH